MPPFYRVPDTLTVHQWSYLTADDYPGDQYQQKCHTVNLAPTPAGYGMVHCTDRHGKRFTLVTLHLERIHQMTCDPTKIVTSEDTQSLFPLACDGWPDDWE